MEHHSNIHQSHSSQREEADNLATYSPLFEVTKVKYQDLFIKIFSDSSLDNNPRHFFFEPLVLLDPKSIVDKSPKTFKQAFIQFTIQMWNDELRIKVLERLRSLKSLQHVQIEEDDVCVLPFEEVLLVCKSGAIPESTRLTNEPTSYLRFKEKLDFYLLCDEHSLVNALAEDFRQNPEFTVSTWQLNLECSGLTGLSSNSTLIKNRPTFSFNVSILSYEVTKLRLTNPISEEPLIIPKRKAVQVTQDVIEQPEATSSTFAITSTTSGTSKKRKGNKKSTTGLAMLTTALRSVSTAASGRKKGGVAKATLANLEEYRKRLDTSPSSSTAAKLGKFGKIKQVDELKVEVESVKKEVSASFQENPASDENDTIIVRPRRSGRLHKVPASTTDSFPIGEESSLTTVNKRSVPETVPKSSPIRKRIISVKAVRSSSGSKPNPLPPSSSASTTSTLPKSPKSSSTPTKSGADIKKKKVLSPLSFIKGSGRKGDNTPWKPMDEVNKLFFGPYVRLVKLDHPPSLSTKSKLKRNHQRAKKAAPTSTGNQITKITGITPLLNPGGSSDACCSTLAESATSKSNGSSSSTDPHYSRAETSTTSGKGPIQIVNPTASQGALYQQDQVEGLSPLSSNWNSSQIAGGTSTDLIPLDVTSDGTPMERSDEVVPFGGASFHRHSTVLPSFTKAFGKKMEGYFDSIPPSYSSTFPLSMTNGSLVTDHTLDASSSALNPAAGDRTFKNQSLLEGAMAKEQEDLKDVNVDTFFGQVTQINYELVKSDGAVDSLLHPKVKVIPSHLKVILTTEGGSSAPMSMSTSKEASCRQILPPSGAGFSGGKNAADGSPCPRY